MLRSEAFQDPESLWPLPNRVMVLTLLLQQSWKDTASVLI